MVRMRKACSDRVRQYNLRSTVIQGQCKTAPIPSTACQLDDQMNRDRNTLRRHTWAMHTESVQCQWRMGSHAEAPG
jgi:hypothetical protein